MDAAAAPALPDERTVVIVRRQASAAQELRPLDADAAILFVAIGKGPRADTIGMRPAGQDRTRNEPAPPKLASLDAADLPALQLASHGSFDATPPWANELEPARPRFAGLDLAPASIGDRDGKALYFGGLNESEFRAREKRCLATAIYFEARGESVEGQIAVAQTIMNRVRSAYYPDTICGVVYQGAERRNACQFSFACDRTPDTPREKPEWETANELAERVLKGEVWLDSVGHASHYHATYVRPDWVSDMRRLTRIGTHVFYRAKVLEEAEGQ